MDDSAILALCRSGQYDQAFSAMVEAWSEKLYWHVRSIVLDHDDADDVVQEAFVKAWNALPAFRGSSGAYTWLWRIATNEALSFLRRKRETVTIDSLSEREGSEGVDGDKAQSLLEQALASLPPRQRAVFSMRYYDELPYATIASVLGVSEGSLKASYHIAEEKVRSFIEDHSE